jgi:hypothetical protein
MSQPKAPKIKVIETPQAPPPPPEDTGEAQDKALGRATQLLNLNEMGYDAQYDEENQKYNITKRAPAAQTPEEIESQRRTAEIEKLMYDKLMMRISPETKRLVGETYASQRTAGNQEIDRYATQNMAARGLNANDSPALREVGLQKQAMETGLRGAEAASLLNSAERDQLFAQAQLEMKNQLQQQTFMNKVMIGQSSGNMGLAQMSNRYSITGRSLSQVTQGGMASGGFNAARGGVGLAAGAASGALAGSAGGPPGMLIGAGVGALGGLLGGFS